MAQKVFISYKYADAAVQYIGNSSRAYQPYGWPSEIFVKTTARNYVTVLQNLGTQDTLFISKGEEDGDDMSMYSESTIQAKLYDRIYDSSVTAVLISPNMRESWKDENMQWIPREISYSLKEFTRSNRTSHSNSLIFVILPDQNGSYDYFHYMQHFNIVKKNIENGYACLVNWKDFIGNIPAYIREANLRRQLHTPYKSVY